MGARPRKLCDLKPVQDFLWTSPILLVVLWNRALSTETDMETCDQSEEALPIQGTIFATAMSANSDSDAPAQQPNLRTEIETCGYYVNVLNRRRLYRHWY